MISIICLDCKNIIKVFNVNPIIKEHWECDKCKSKNLLFLEKENEKTSHEKRKG